MASGRPVFEYFFVEISFTMYLNVDGVWWSVAEQSLTLTLVY